jgi:hypothetical protein
MVAVVGGIFSLLLIFGLAIASKSSKSPSKRLKDPVAVSEVKPRSAEEILLDAEALMQRNDYQGFIRNMNKLFVDFPDSYESFVAEEVIQFSRASRKLTNTNNTENETISNDRMCQTESIIKSYNALAVVCANYANSSDLEKKRVADALFRAYSLANPDYTLAGLLESLKSIELSRQLALGNVSAPRSTGKPARLVPTKVAWIKEKKNQEKMRQESIDLSNQKKQAIEEKRNNSLKAKYRGVRLRAESGSSEAMLELSEMLRNGIGCEKDLKEADQWLIKSSQKTMK